MDTTGLVVALIVAAMVFFLLEILTPMFGLLAGLGIAALAGAIGAAYSVHYVFGLVMLVLTIVWVPAYLIFLVRVLPKTPLGKRMFLQRARKATGEAAPESEKYESLIGAEGVAATLLRPSGAVKIDGQRIIAIAEQGVIHKGTPVRVIGASGTNVIVRAADEPTES